MGETPTVNGQRLTAKRSWLRAMTGSARADNEAYAEGLKSGLLGLTRSSNGLSPRIQSGKDLNTLLCCRNQQLQLNISLEKRILSDWRAVATCLSVRDARPVAKLTFSK